VWAEDQASQDSGPPQGLAPSGKLWHSASAVQAALPTRARISTRVAAGPGRTGGCSGALPAQALTNSNDKMANGRMGPSCAPSAARVKRVLQPAALTQLLSYQQTFSVTTGRELRQLWRERVVCALHCRKEFFISAELFPQNIVQLQINADKKLSKVQYFLKVNEIKVEGWKNRCLQ
jgi:hypothetical protein